MRGFQLNQVWGIILAAGHSRRMGKDKLLLPYKEKSILRHVIDQSLNSSLSGISVVVNPEVPGLIQEADGANKVMINDQLLDEISTSIKLGIHSVPNEMNAVMFLMGDQPLLSTGDINNVIQQYDIHGSLLVQATYKANKGYPVIFDREMFPQLLKMSGNEGLDTILTKFQHQTVYAEMSKEPLQDIDTLKDYEELISKLVVG